MNFSFTADTKPKRTLVKYIFLLSLEIFSIFSYCLDTVKSAKLCNRGPRLTRGETSDGIAVRVHAFLVRVPLSTLQRVFCRGCLS
jgi:hypothetical protein